MPRWILSGYPWGQFMYILPFLSISWWTISILLNPMNTFYLLHSSEILLSSMISVIWLLRASLMVALCSKIQHDYSYVLSSCWRWATVEFVVMVGLKPWSSWSYHGVNIANLAFIMSFVIRLMGPYFYQPSLMQGWRHCHKMFGSI